LPDEGQRQALAPGFRWTANLSGGLVMAVTLGSDVLIVYQQ